jgi:hypothetical protein
MLRSHKFRDFNSCKAVSLIALMVVVTALQATA